MTHSVPTWHKKLHLSGLDAVMLTPPLAKRFLPLPDRLHAVGSMCRCGATHPGKDLDEPGLAPLLGILHENVRLGEDKALMAIMFPGL